MPTFAHNAPYFACEMCSGYQVKTYQALQRHRESKHIGYNTQDNFSVSCNCTILFCKRIRALHHDKSCILRDSVPNITLPDRDGPQSSPEMVRSNMMNSSSSSSSSSSSRISSSTLEIHDTPTEISTSSRSGKVTFSQSNETIPKSSSLIGSPLQHMEISQNGRNSRNFDNFNMSVDTVSSSTTTTEILNMINPSLASQYIQRYQQQITGISRKRDEHTFISTLDRSNLDLQNSRKIRICSSDQDETFQKVRINNDQAVLKIGDSSNAPKRLSTKNKRKSQTKSDSTDLLTCLTVPAASKCPNHTSTSKKYMEYFQKAKEEGEKRMEIARNQPLKTTSKMTPQPSNPSSEDLENDMLDDLARQIESEMDQHMDQNEKEDEEDILKYLGVDSTKEHDHQRKIQIPTNKRPISSTRFRKDAAEVHLKVQDLAYHTLDRLEDMEAWGEIEILIEEFTSDLYNIAQPTPRPSSRPANQRPPKVPKAPEKVQSQPKSKNKANMIGRELQHRKRPSKRQNDRQKTSNKISDPGKKQSNKDLPDHLKGIIREAKDDLRAQHRESYDQKLRYRAKRKVARRQKAVNRFRLQRDFQWNEKKTMRKILSGSNSTTEPRCDLSSKVLTKYFTETHAAPQDLNFEHPEGSIFRSAMENLPEVDPETNQELLEDISNEEIMLQLKKVNGKSAAGLDGLAYGLYKEHATTIIPVLLGIFQICWKKKKIPTTWKQAKTILIYKKGDATDPTNWRPINLQNAIYKIYAGILANRYMRWMELNKRISPSQKGFREVNGCHEHNFLAASILNTTRRSKKKLFVVWYDLANAFGTIPHQFLFKLLQMMKIPKQFQLILQDIYLEASFSVQTKTELTPFIQNQRGVFQGCPLSPRLFLAAVEPLLRVLSNFNTEGMPLAPNLHANCSAYADDIKIFSQSEKGIKNLHDIMLKYLKWTTMRANPSKCAALGAGISGKGTRISVNLDLQIENKIIPTISIYDSYKYLGISDGFDPSKRRLQLGPLLRELTKDATTIFKSELAPWQKIKALKTYIYSRLDYPFRNLRPLQQQLAAIDSHITRLIRHCLKLPIGTTKNIFYTATGQGGLGLLPLTQLHPTLQITHGVQMLNSGDASTSMLAISQLKEEIKKRFIIDPDILETKIHHYIQNYLNKTMETTDSIEKNRHGDLSTIWTDIRRHLHKTGLQLQHDPSLGFQIINPSNAKKSIYIPKKQIAFEIKKAIKANYCKEWSKLPDQGKTAPLHGGKGSTFLISPRTLSESDYIFGIKARANQILTRSVLQRQRVIPNAKCRKCGYKKETLAHVINHCPSNEGAIRYRHDTGLTIIEKTIQKATTKSTIVVNSTVKGFQGPTLKPDLQIYLPNKKCVMLDLAVTFEATDKHFDQPHTSFQDIRKYKVQKYQKLKEYLTKQGYSVQLDAIVYGSLGSVDPANEKIYLSYLGLSKVQYTRMERQLSELNIINGNRIWRKHALSATPHQKPNYRRPDPSTLAKPSHRNPTTTKSKDQQGPRSKFKATDISKSTGTTFRERRMGIRRLQ